MFRAIFTPQRVFVMVVSATLIAALLPARLLAWTNLPAEIVGLPLAPFGHWLSSVGPALRPPEDSHPGVSEASRELIEHLESERDEYQRLYLIEKKNAEQLQEQLKSYQEFGAETSGRPVKSLSASIVLRSPGSPHGSVILNRGAVHGVTIGTVAEHSRQLVGKVIEVSRVQCTLLPLTNRDTRWITVVIQPGDRQRSRPDELRPLQFLSTGDGAFITDADRTFPISIGDVALMMDDAWPESARGRKIGIVESVVVNDADPLRNKIVVRPQFQVAQVSRLMLVIEQDEPASGGASGSAP